MDRVAVAIALVASVALAAGCAGDERCNPDEEPCYYETTVSTVEAPPGFEDDDICQSWTLNNPTELWVRRVGQSNDGVWHHANWFYVPDDQYDVPDGAWSCSEENFQELIAAILGGYLFAMTTQSASEEQLLPAGSAVRIPPYSRIIGASHVLNASDQEQTTAMRFFFETVPPDEVEAPLTPARIEYRDLAIQPRAKSSFTAECHIDQTYLETMGVPLEFELYYMLPHYHDLGAWSEVALAGGPRDGEVLYRFEGFGGDSIGHAFDPPIDIVAAGATGLRWTCGYDNPRDETVAWGIGDQEMCVTAIFARTDMGWEGDVSEGSEQVGVASDGTIEYEGPCSILGLPWDHDKPGGPPRG